ncbi:MAG: prepilin-type N-terminal cleavage/methylation domain-containing protein [Patescibacteria group bacterium]|jgi:prepilin-type N-terminal cleavage/methylation domain-containing protein
MIGNKAASGFTIIEVIVSVALFSVIILIATQIFLMVVDSQRSALATQNVQESLKYFLEVTAKEMRMAQKNNDPENICLNVSETVSENVFKVSLDSAGNNILNFKNYYGDCVTYSVAPDLTTPTTQRFKIKRQTGSVTADDFISPAKINIDHLYFILNAGPSAQPMVTINLQAHAVGQDKYKSTMTIQTSITSRYYK